MRFYLENQNANLESQASRVAGSDSQHASCSPSKVVEEAEEGHDGVARLDVLQCTRHLPFRGCTAGDRLSKSNKRQPFFKTIIDFSIILTR